jgi:hypothetical protein
MKIASFLLMCLVLLACALTSPPIHPEWWARHFEYVAFHGALTGLSIIGWMVTTAQFVGEEE